MEQGGRESDARPLLWVAVWYPYCELEDASFVQALSHKHRTFPGCTKKSLLGVPPISRKDRCLVTAFMIMTSINEQVLISLMEKYPSFRREESSRELSFLK